MYKLCKLTGTASQMALPGPGRIFQLLLLLSLLLPRLGGRFVSGLLTPAEVEVHRAMGVTGSLTACG